MYESDNKTLNVRQMNRKINRGNRRLHGRDKDRQREREAHKVIVYYSKMSYKEMAASSYKIGYKLVICLTRLSGQLPFMIITNIA